jgi:hypothetical protein
VSWAARLFKLKNQNGLKFEYTGSWKMLLPLLQH